MDSREHMKYQRTTIDKWKFDIMLVAFFGLLFAVLSGAVAKQVEAIMYPDWDPLSPLAQDQYIVINRPYLEENLDTWIASASAKFANVSKPESYLKYQLHCLANKESGHRYNGHTKCGDGGLSCGLYQWREASWEIMRNKMIADDQADEVGSLWDDELQVYTTAYALTHSYDHWWGPINRGSCQ